MTFTKTTSGGKSAMAAGPAHYRKAEELLAEAAASRTCTYEGNDPEADRLIAAAHVHAQLAGVAVAALKEWSDTYDAWKPWGDVVLESGPDHYRKAEELLAETSTIPTSHDGTNPEEDRFIAAAHVHAQLAGVAVAALKEWSDAHDAWKPWGDAILPSPETNPR